MFTPILSDGKTFHRIINKFLRANDTGKDGKRLEDLLKRIAKSHLFFNGSLLQRKRPSLIR